MLKSNYDALFSFATMDIMEHFLPRDVSALIAIVNILHRSNMLIVEIGSWKGYSTAHLATCIKHSGGVLYAIDKWEDENIRKTFEHNLVSLGLNGFVQLMQMASLEACKTFEDRSLDMVFIDANHTYKQFKDDLECWWPKVKAGGVICGHDCEAKYSELPIEQRNAIENKIDYDFIEIYGLHPGVIKSLYEKFNDDYRIMPNSRVWCKVNDSSKS